MHKVSKNDLIHHGSIGDVTRPMATAISVHAAAATAAATCRRACVYVSQTVLLTAFQCVTSPINTK